MSNIKRILLKLKEYWRNADLPGKMIILVFFAPSMCVLLWLLSEITYLVVFELPLLVIKIAAKILLFCIFWSAAVYFYEKLYCMMSERTVDAEETDETVKTQNMEGSETKKERKIRWRNKDSI
jgi:hypothetical protein